MQAPCELGPGPTGFWATVTPSVGQKTYEFLNSGSICADVSGAAVVLGVQRLSVHRPVPLFGGRTAHERGMRSE